MALLFMDGFSAQDAGQKWNFGSGSYTTFVPGVNSRVSGCYYASVGSNNTFSKTIPASSKVFMGAGFNPQANNTNFQFQVYGDNGVTGHISLFRNGATGKLDLIAGGVTVASTTSTITTSLWVYVEMSATIADAGGTVEVRLNGSPTPEINFTGDTKNGGTNNTIDKVVVANFTNTTWLADLYVCNDTGTTNNNFLGDVCVRTLVPNADGAFSQLTGSDGNQVANYLLVDERPASAADYTGSPTTGLLDTYGITDLPAGISAVYGAQLTSVMAKSDATAATAKPVVRSSGTNYFGTTQTLSTSYTHYYDLFENDPATGVLWTVGGINAAEIGMEVV